MITTLKSKFLLILTLLMAVATNATATKIAFEPYTVVPGETKTLTLSITDGSLNFIGFQADIKTHEYATVTNIAFAANPNVDWNKYYTLKSNLTSDKNDASFIIMAKDINYVPESVSGPFLSVTIHLDENASAHSELIHLEDVKAETEDGNHIVDDDIENGEWTGTIKIPVKSIAVSPTQWGGVVGEEQELTATIEPFEATNKDVSWSSSNPSVATVDENGLVKAVGIGNATITVSSIDNNGIKATCAVTVAAKVIPAESISLSAPSWKGKVGESTTITATVGPDDATNKAVIWTSSDESIATVVNGKIEAKAVGKATITATVEGTTVSATCAVEVEKTPVTAVKLSESTLSLVEDDSKTLTATVEPTDATDKAVTWSSSNTAVATVDQTGKVTAVKAGEATITATSKDNSNAKASCAVTVTAKVIAVTSISVAPTTWSGKVGATTTLTATISPANATNKKVVWSSSNTAIATVDENGTVSAKAIGKATITATVENTNVSATCAVEVEKTPVTAVKLSESTLSLVEDDSKTLTATVEPTDATDKALTWSSSNTAVATVDQTGKVTAVKAGTAIITATSKDNPNATASCAVTVTAKVIAVTSISVAPTTWSGKVGATTTLTATISPANATNKKVVWSSSNTAIATVDENGTVTAKAIGNAIITAKAEGTTISASCAIEVVKTPVSSISVIPTEWTGTKGQTTTLAATVLPADATNKTVKWTSSNPTVASVDQNGKVIAMAVGEATITASSADNDALTAECKVTVKPILVSSISFDIEEWGGVIGESVQIKATVAPENATTKTLKWTSSNEAVATVNNAGLVKAVGEGDAFITAEATDGSGVKATCAINVDTNEIHPESISLTPTEWSGKVTDRVTLVATVLPAETTNKAVTWKSNNENIVKVDNKGNLTPVSVGTAVVTVTSEEDTSISATCKITVIATPVESITLSSSEWSDFVGATTKLTATITPESATNKTLTWASSTPTVASVDKDGNVKALKVGEATITATAASGVKAECKVTVKPVLVSAIELSAETWGGVVGETVKLTATVTPTNATNKAVVWSSANNAIATIDADGNVKAVAAGETIVTATAADGSGIKAECHVTVSAKVVKATSIAVNETLWSGKVGETITLKATVLPADATNKNVTWSSSNPEYATVDAKGVVTAVAVGKANITTTTTDGSGLSASCQVTVVTTSVETITLSATEWTGIVGGRTQLTATVAPESATNKDITWSSSDTKVASVDQNGNVRAAGVGSAIITATAADKSGIKAECKVTVNPVLVSAIELSVDTWGGVVGETVKLTATVTPTNATNKTVTWSSANEAIATVDAEGNVKAIAAGETTITATAADGSGIKAECHVTVSVKVVKATSIALSASQWSGKVDETITLKATVLPADATNKTVKWTSSDSEIAAVDSKGLVTAMSVGKATITATTADGTELSASCQVTVLPTPVETITLSATTWSATVGAKTRLTATVEPENATNADVRWTSSDTKIATVDKDGNVTAVAVGSAVITATAADGSGVKAECRVTVNPVLVSSITLSDDTWGGVVGESFKLTATVAPANATTKVIDWSTSDESVATVDAEGNVKAIAVGETVIKATAHDGSGVSAECHVTVSANIIKATSISLVDTEWSGKAGESVQLKAIIQPVDATNKAVRWTSSDTEIATVDSKGLLTAVSVGNATVTATTADGSELSATCNVTVLPTLVETITLSATTWSGTVGASTKFTASVEPDNATNTDVKWSSSDATVASVDQEGNVKALKVGSAVITATAADGSGVKAECRVTVTPVLVKTITLSDDTWGGVVGESIKLTATVTPDNATNKTIDWSTSDAAIATVDAEGNVKAVAVGEAIITATAHDGSGVTAECHVTVSANIITASSISLNATEWSGKAGETVALKATVLPADATNKAVRWSTSNADVATVDSKGLVTAISVGEATITATTADGSNLSASCNVTVVPTPVETITLSATNWSGTIGATTQLTATVEPSDATNAAVIWSSSDATIASVDQEGNIKALKVGSATITATAADGSGITATCRVTVRPILVKSIELSEVAWGGVVGESVKLTATITPDNATNKAIDWSTSDAAIATVDAEGNVTAVAVGEAVITATAHDGSGVTAECHVTVSANIIKATAISLSATEWSGKAGETVALKATVLPADATNKAVRWSTSNADVATVDSKGLVTAVAVGSAIITATTADGTELSATCEVTVVPTPVETITLSATTWSGIVGATTQLSATVEPTDATDAAVIWSSTNESVATVDATGFITALKVGSATITATAADGSGVTATCRVTVKPVLATSLTIDPENWEGEVGETFTITATVLPENTTDQSLAWSSSDEAVATVDSTGLVTTVGEGTCTIEVTTLDGSELKAECIVVTSLAGLSEIIADSDAATDVYTLDGILVKRDCTAEDLRQLNPGFYIIRQGTKSKKIYLSTRP